MVKKPTALQNTKLSVFKEFHQVRCTGDHQHCPLEGSAIGFGRRTRYLESYQPGLASVLAAALMVDEPPSISDFVGAVGEDRQHVGAHIKLMTTNRVEAVRTVQRLHRNLGHPAASSLVELLESREPLMKCWKLLARIIVLHVRGTGSPINHLLHHLLRL